MKVSSPNKTTLRALSLELTPSSPGGAAFTLRPLQAPGGAPSPSLALARPTASQSKPGAANRFHIGDAPELAATADEVAPPCIVDESESEILTISASKLSRRSPPYES
eukprot:6174344-Pleurochrysis_carterae.AAC.1